MRAPPRPNDLADLRPRLLFAVEDSLTQLRANLNGGRDGARGTPAARHLPETKRIDYHIPLGQ